MPDEPHLQPPNVPADDFELKIDTQVEKFLDLKQKFTYFLVTAAVAVAVFVFNQAAKNPANSIFMSVLLCGTGVGGIFAAGCSLMSIHYEIISYRKHIRFRYERKTWDELDEDSKKSWNLANKRAKKLFTASMVVLFCEILFAILFLAFSVMSRPPEQGAVESRGHHHGRVRCIIMERIR
jgi:Na+/melibiose symporter-like transporter